MVTLLITNEIEPTAHETVYEAVSKEVEGADLDLNLSKLLRHVTNSGSLQAVANAQYVAFVGIQRVTTPETLEGVLASIKQAIDHRDNSAVLNASNGSKTN